MAAPPGRTILQSPPRLGPVPPARCGRLSPDKFVKHKIAITVIRLEAARSRICSSRSNFMAIKTWTLAAQIACGFARERMNEIGAGIVVYRWSFPVDSLH